MNYPSKVCYSDIRHMEDLFKLPIVPRLEAEELDYARDRIGRAVLEDAIRSGEVPVANVSEEDLAVQLIQHLRRFRAGTAPIELMLDHTEDLLEEAQRARAQGRTWIACILSATSIEHWINKLIVIAADRQGMTRQAITQMLRDANFRAKTTWVFELLELPPIPDDLIRVLNELLEHRNAYVHYKWHVRGLDEFDDEERRARESIDAFLGRVSELDAIEYAAFTDAAAEIVGRILG
jgi:hypothetical protein